MKITFSGEPRTKIQIG